MEGFFNDLRECFKISLKVFFISFVIGIVIGVISACIKKNFNIVLILEWGSRFVTYASCFGLFISAISFTKKDLMRPLNYNRQWKTYFSKFNLAHVIFFSCVFCLIYSIIIGTILFYFKV